MRVDFSLFVVFLSNLPLSFTQQCLLEGEGNCKDLNDNQFGPFSEINCELGLCCDPDLNGVCGTIDTLSEIRNINYTFDPINLSCSTFPTFCRGTIFRPDGLYCSCRQGCETIGMCCNDANITCENIWDSLTFCEERILPTTTNVPLVNTTNTTTTNQPQPNITITNQPQSLFDNGCCSGNKPSCGRRHWQNQCIKKGCNWNINSQLCNLNCCAKIPGVRAVKGLFKCKSLNQTQCTNRNDCQTTLCDTIGQSNDESGPWN